MATIPDTVTIDITADKLKLTTQTNGDVIILTGLNLTYDQAATLAWLINQPIETLEVKVRIKP